MWKIFWCSAAAIGSLVLLVAWTGATSNFLYHHPTQTDVRMVIHKETGTAVVEAIAYPERAPPAPRVRVPQVEHEFGRMDPGSSGSHAFQITNAGNAPLELRLGPTSCKCTLSGLDKRNLEPGETAMVKLDWNTGSTKDSYFAQTATVFTNDPLNKRIDFVVKGGVKMLAGLNVEEINLGALAPDKPATTEFLIHSQMWTDFTVEEVSGGFPNLTWTAEAVEPTALPELEMLSIRRVRLQFDRPAAKGKFAEELRVRVAPTGGGDAVELYLPISGTSQRRLAFYGSTIDERGMIDLGNIPQGQGLKAKLLVKVRDADRNLTDIKISTTPEFLQARLAPHAGASDAGLYDLFIEVPANTPPCQYRSNQWGTLRIETSHPRIDPVELKVTFIVLPRLR